MYEVQYQFEKELLNITKKNKKITAGSNRNNTYFLSLLGLTDIYPLSPLHKSAKDVGGDDDVFMVNITTYYIRLYIFFFVFTTCMTGLLF